MKRATSVSAPAKEKPAADKPTEAADGTKTRSLDREQVHASLDKNKNATNTKGEERLLDVDSEISDKEAAAVEKQKEADAEAEEEEAEPLVLGQTFAALETMDLPDFVRQHNTTLTFPQKLMLMLMHMEKIFAVSGKRPDQAPIGWVDGGLAFYIRNKQELVSKWLPLFFRQAKFSSFTRKLYRWGFRQVNVDDDDDNESQLMHFGNENFQRDRKGLMAKMRSITAAGRRREEEAGTEERKMTDFAAPVAPEVNEELRQLIQRRLFSQQLSSSNLSQMASQAGLFGLSSLGTQSDILQLAASRHQQLHPLISGQDLAGQQQQQQQQQQLLSLSQLARGPIPSMRLGQLPLATAVGVNLPLLLEQQRQRQQRQLEMLQLQQQQSRSPEEQERLRMILDSLMGGGDSAVYLPPPAPPS